MEQHVLDYRLPNHLKLLSHNNEREIQAETLATKFPLLFEHCDFDFQT